MTTTALTRDLWNGSVEYLRLVVGRHLYLLVAFLAIVQILTLMTMAHEHGTMTDATFREGAILLGDVLRLVVALYFVAPLVALVARRYAPDGVRAPTWEDLKLG